MTREMTRFAHRREIQAADGWPEQASPHLARVLAVVAERHPVAAELACGAGGLDGHELEARTGFRVLDHAGVA